MSTIPEEPQFGYHAEPVHTSWQSVVTLKKNPPTPGIGFTSAVL
jgi:hypothetical protein